MNNIDWIRLLKAIGYVCLSVLVVCTALYVEHLLIHAFGWYALGFPVGAMLFVLLVWTFYEDIQPTKRKG